MESRTCKDSKSEKSTSKTCIRCYKIGADGESSSSSHAGKTGAENSRGALDKILENQTDLAADTEVLTEREEVP